MANPPKSAAAMTRLPQYYRVLKQFLQKGIYRCSSEEIALQANCSPTAVRSDLAAFRGCAKQGYGYHVKQLYTALGSYLGVLDEFRAVLIGSGAAAQVICEHPLIAVHGIRLCGIFSPAASTAAPQGVPCHTDLARLPEFCLENGVSLLLLTEPIPLPLWEALPSAGIRGVWNLSESTLPPQAGICVRELHPFDSLMSLCCALKQGQPSPTKE